MIAVVALSAALVLGAADAKNEAWVVITKRSGVAKAATAEFAKTISETLAAKGVPNSTEPTDLTSCNARLVCLIEAGMKKKVTLLVTVEVASVLDDVVIHSEVFSVDEDGKKISTFDYEGAPRAFSADAARHFDDTFVPAIRSSLGIAAAPIAKDAPKEQPKTIAAPPPEAKPTVAEASVPPPEVVEPASPGMSTQKKIGIGVAAVGAVGLVVAAGMGGSALGSAGTSNSLCPAGSPCTNPAAYTAYDSARSAQTTATVFAVAGGVLLAAGAVLFFVDFGGGDTVAATPAVSTDGAGVLVHGSF